MSNEVTVDGRIERLRNGGDAHDSTDWSQGNPDYVAEYSLPGEQISSSFTATGLPCCQIASS